MPPTKLCPTCGKSYGPESVFCPLDRTSLLGAEGGGDLLGTVVADRYLLSELLGAGGMGEVYRAQDVRLQRPAAVKLLRASLCRDLESLARFSREGTNASRINHPHVAQVYDAGETTEGVPYLAMEFVPGESLKRVLEREGHLDRRRAVELVRQIALGLDAAHRLGVVHRDLKPDNVLVTTDEFGSELAKIVDFGISRAMRDEAQRVTRAGYVAGTYEFMSPEQVTGGEVAQQSDVYALGLIAFVLLTGKLPFPGETAEHSMLMRLREPPRPLRTMRPEEDWPTPLQAVMDRVLALDPGERPGSAGEFATALAAAVAGSPVAPAAAAAPVGTSSAWVETATARAPSALPGRTHRAWSGLAILTGAGVVAALALGVVVVGGMLFSGPGNVTTATSVDTADTSSFPNDISESEPPSISHSNGTGSGDSAGPRSVVLSASEARRELDRYKNLLHLGLPPDSAKRALRSLDRLLPRLPTEGDSVLAKNLRAKAYALAHPTPGGVPDAPAATKAEAAADYEAARQALRSFESLPDMSPDSARFALEALDRLLPRLRTRHDSVDAAIYRAEAYALMGQTDPACAILEQARPGASPVQRSKMEIWVKANLCPATAWEGS